jgi:hypothetical protein
MAEWGKVLLDALRFARSSGGLPWEETLHREVVAKLALASAGVESELIRSGLDEIWVDFVHDLIEEGERPEKLRSEVSSIQAVGPRSIPPRRLQQVQRIRFVLREMARYRERLSGASREALDQWERSLMMR